MVKIGHYEVKQDLWYFDNYIWIDRLNDSELRIGISDYGQHALKDITSIALPSSGQRIMTNSDLLTIESISKEYVMKSPVSCVILDINQRVQNSPEILNSKPFENWLVRVEVLNLSDLDKLIDGDEMADMILDEIGMEPSSDNDGEDEDFDYESEFSIDSGDYDDFDKDYDDDYDDYDDFNDSYDDDDY